MECSEAKPLIHGYVDQELDLVRTLDVERHLETCADCAGEWSNVRSVRSALRAPELVHAVPPRLEASIRAAVRREAPRRVPGWFGWFTPALAAAAAVALALFLLPRARMQTVDDQLAREVIADHARSLLASHLSDVASTDRHTVKPWFNGKIDYAPPVVDLKEQGYPLIGGRLDYLDRRTVAALVYRRRKHTINLFIWPEGRSDGAADAIDGPDHRVISRDGFSIVHWREGGMRFWAISDVAAADLQDFARAFDLAAK
jgi:anti-sigma factor RsiW